jgi:hypothetical protein
LETFPGATLVYCHRHPRETIPSFARVAELARLTRSTQSDPVELGDEMLGYWSGQLDTNLDLRDEGYGPDALDLRYEDIRDRAPETIATIYERLGRSVSPAVATAYTSWDEANPINKFGRNEYTLERFELTGERIDERFSRYIARFFSER